MDRATEPWEQFWLASELSDATAPGFAARINDFAPPTGRLPRATYGAAPHRLPAPPDDDLARTVATRRTIRTFGDGRLDDAAIGSLFAAFADPRLPPVEPATDSPQIRGQNVAGSPRRQAWPSAGGLYPLEIYAGMLDVDHPLRHRVVHYEPDLHALTGLGACPPWDELRSLLSSDALAGVPQLVVWFVLDTELAEERYGNRAGRFALIEVGHAAQNLALRLAADRLAGCELGGAHDRAVLDLLGLNGTPLRVALAYACGTRAT